MSTTNFSSVAACAVVCSAIRCEEDLELSKY